MSGGYVLCLPLVCLRVSVRRAGECIYISAWASALSVLTGLGNAKAFVERDGQQVQTPALFSYMHAS